MFMELFMPLFRQGFRAAVGGVVLLTVVIIASCGGTSYSLLAIAGIVISTLLLLFLKGGSIGAAFDYTEPPPPYAYVGTFESAIYPEGLVRGTASLVRPTGSADLRLTYTGRYRNSATTHLHHEGELTDSMTAPFEGGTVTFTFDTLTDTVASGTYELDMPVDRGTFTLRRG